ncbi:MAG: RNA polymerase factor sigma-54 [Planctomycetota bacterium]|nr:RNA polymerase factor sigma-54 [Planctomycetota bacterium]
MDLQPGLTTSTQQRFALLPNLLKSIEVLQLTSADLLSLIDRELEGNETLVAETATGEAPDSGPGDSQGAASESWESFQSLAGPAAKGGEDNKQVFLNNLAGPDATLEGHVMEQISWLELPAEIVRGVSSLAERLDQRGLLTESDEELLELLDQEALDQCLEILQSLEPRGIGARGPVDAMLLQVSGNDPDFLDIRALLTVHIDALAKNKLPEVARALGRPIEEVGDLVQRIKKLDPCPGADFAVDGEADCVHPEVKVRLLRGEIEIEIDDMVLPDLGIQPDYESMAADGRVDRRTRSYLRTKLRSARELIHAVEQRKVTLGRVTLAIMSHQIDFLVHGPLSVRPLCMSQVAEQVGLHPSTVSRAIAGKFVQTDHGVFRLREFFDGDRRSVSTGAEASGRMAVKDHIRDLIANEGASSPLSDDELVHRLRARNIKVARRTVAKYRTELGFSSSWRRRAYRARD